MLSPLSPPLFQVRDRATLYLKLLDGEVTVGETEKDVNEFLFGSLDIPLVNLETSLQNYVCIHHLFT
jgi:coatomer subunit gamma